MAARLLPARAAASTGTKVPGHEERNAPALEIKTDFALKQKLLERHFFHLDVFPRAGREIGEALSPQNDLAASQTKGAFTATQKE